MAGNALGLIEVIGYPAAVEAADAALKAAQVKLLGITKVGSGIVTVQLLGDIGAMRAAVDAGTESAKRIGKIRSQHVIARAESSVLDKMIMQSTKNKLIKAVDPLLENIMEEKSRQESVEIIIRQPREIEEKIEIKTEIKTEEDLNKLSTAQLKMLLMEKGINLSSKELKSLKKQELIEMIEKQKTSKEGDKQ